MESKEQNNIEKYRVDGMSLKNKMDKIVAALHMVTDCIEDNEPIRFKLRSLSVELASESHELIYIPARDRGFIFAEIEVVATQIMSFLRIAQSVRMVSEMNAQILIRELSGNMDRMRSWVETGFYETENSGFAQAGMATPFTLNESHFKTDDQVFREPQLSSQTPVTQQSMIQQQAPKIVPQAPVSKGHIQTVNNEIQKNRQNSETNKKFEFAMKLSRRNAILKIIKDKKEVTIKDISNLIADCSEKTIQREFIALVSEGVLKKVGEKRWSKYMLA
jgi:hypothetical protein